MISAYPDAPATGETFVGHTLTNGLTVLVEERPAVPIAAVNLWYSVGSRHELSHQRGLAHLFEHLMFQGSRNVAAGEHASVLEGLGAQFNATTSFDRTNYFETVPVHALSTTLWLEADRMASLALSQREFEAQRDVVKNERLQTLVEVPYGETMVHLLPMLLPPDHPYATLPIGEMAHLDAAVLDDLHAFFTRHYTPSNAVVSVVGDVRVEEVLELADSFFGGIAGGPRPEVDPVPTLAPLGRRTTKNLVADVPSPAVFRAWRIPTLTDTAMTACEIASLVLGGGESSRLRSRLVRDQGTALDVQAGVMGLAAGNSVFMANAFLPDDGSHEQVIEDMDAELVRLASDVPTEEFEAAIARRERQLIESMERASGRADALSAAHTIHGDAAHADALLERIRALSPEDVVHQVSTWLDPDASATLTYQPSTTQE